MTHAIVFLSGVLCAVLVMVVARVFRRWRHRRTLERMIARGPSLDLHGSMWGVKRADGETDDAYRARIARRAQGFGGRLERIAGG